MCKSLVAVFYVFDCDFFIILWDRASYLFEVHSYVPLLQYAFDSFRMALHLVIFIISWKLMKYLTKNWLKILDNYLVYSYLFFFYITVGTFHSFFLLWNILYYNFFPGQFSDVIQETWLVHVQHYFNTVFLSTFTYILFCWHNFWGIY